MVLFDAMLLIFIYYANTARHLALKITEDSEEFWWCIAAFLCWTEQVFSGG